MSALPEPAAALPPGAHEDERLLRAHVSRLVEPGDGHLDALLATGGWAAVAGALHRRTVPDAWLARAHRLQVPTERLLEGVARLGVRVVVPGDREWPAGLDDLGPRGKGAPACLWVRGVLDTEGESCLVRSVSVVGARACSSYGTHTAAELAAGLAARGVTVVSGAAYGIDAAAHRAAAGLGGRAVGDGSAADAEAVSPPPTVAVLAGGADRASPAGNERLLRTVLDAGGAVVSEVPPGTRPAPHRFLQRNRLIAAWSAVTVVVEASYRSGALSTARTAGELYRDVAAVPGSVESALSVGTHDLIREGAVLIRSAADVLEQLRPFRQLHLPVPEQQTTRGTPAGGQAGPRQSRRAADAREPRERVLQALRRSTGRDLEAVVAATGLSHRDAATAAAALELDGLAERGPDGWRRGAQVPGGDGVVP